MNLIEGLRAECNRVRKLIAVYDELPGGVGAFGSMALKKDVRDAETAIATMDTVAMVRMYKTLQEAQ